MYEKVTTKPPEKPFAFLRMDVKDEQTSTVDIKETNTNEESKTTSSESKPSINSNTIQVEPKDVFQCRCLDWNKRFEDAISSKNTIF